MIRPINMVRMGKSSYSGVEDQIFGLLRSKLGDHPVSETCKERCDEAINFGLFLRQGRYDKSTPMPIDVFMSHGLADKNYLLARDVKTGRRLINSYEHVLVPGRWFVDRLRHRRFDPRPKSRITLRSDQIHIAGWPRLDPLFQNGGAERLAGGRLRVLWAPSHDISKRDRSFSSYPAFEEYLPELQKRFDVRISLHPANRSDKSPTEGDISWADVVISDFGTMLYEAFALDKCVVMPTWLLPRTISEDHTQRYSAEGRVYGRKIGNHARSFDDLVAMIERHEPPGDDVKRLMIKILAPEYRGRSAARIAELLKILPVKRLGAR